MRARSSRAPIREHSDAVFFFLSKVLWWLAKPSSILVLALLFGLIASLLRWRHIGRSLIVLGAVGFILVAIEPIDDLVLWPLEQRFPAVRVMPDHLDGIIVLGGAIEPGLTAKYGMPALNDAAERVTAFVTLARAYPTAKLIFTGGSGLLERQDLREADTAKQLFADLGLDTSRILFKRDSRNTYENAVFSKRLADPRPGERWALITSAMHMPRAVGCFREVGWTVLPWPVGYKAFNEGLLGNLGLKLEQLDLGVHEWIGLVAYRLAGRSSALFPAPAP